MRAERSTMRMMATAIAVAYLVVLQALLGGLASGTHTGSAFVRDAFGQVICVGADHGIPAEPGQHAPDCCATACQLSFAGTAPPPSAIAFIVPVAVPTEALFPPPARSARLGIQPGPHRARAPPLA